MIDHDRIHWSFARFQTQAELFLSMTVRCVALASDVTNISIGASIPRHKPVPLLCAQDLRGQAPA